MAQGAPAALILARILSRAAPLARRGFSLRAVVIALPENENGAAPSGAPRLLRPYL